MDGKGLQMVQGHDFRAKRKTLILIGSILFIFSITAYSLWFSYQEEKRECLRQLEMVTAFLIQKMPADSFEAMGTHGSVADNDSNIAVQAIHQKIQPILDNVLTTLPTMKFGVYSRQHQKIVAIGPSLDKSLLGPVHFSDAFENMYETQQQQTGENRSSATWYGAPVLYHRRPIIVDNQVVGHVFANINMDKFDVSFWQRTAYTMGGGAITLLVVIVLFQEAFIRLKKDLEDFAKAIVAGQARQFESKIPELNPVLQVIREQTEQMTRLDRLNTIGEMAASIGHEVRNPLTTVRGFLQHMGRKEKFADSREFFQLMIDELDRANSIITEFLSLAKNKAMDFHQLRIGQIVAEVAPLLQADALRFKCQLEVSLTDTANIRADANSLRQLILNLVRNAIEAMPQGGTVKISASSEGSEVLLSVEDEGVGIPADLLEKLGTPFFTTKDNGTGLGLAVCYRIAQRHEAVITVRSQSGRGTVFLVAFKQYRVEAENIGRC